MVKVAVAVLGVGMTLAGCASAPVVRSPLISTDGEFRGPVVAKNTVPISARYEGYCESRPYRWQRGSYRAYTPRPCGTVTVRRASVVRAKY